MEILFDLVLDDLAGFIFEILFEIAVRLAEAIFHLTGWLLRCLRRWLDWKPNIDSAQLSTLQTCVRTTFAIGLIFCIWALLLWLVWR